MALLAFEAFPASVERPPKWPSGKAFLSGEGQTLIRTQTLSRALSWSMSGSFESVRWNTYVHRLDLGLYSHLKEFLGNGVRTHINSKGKIPLTGTILLRGAWNPRRCIMKDSQPNTLPTELFRPITSTFHFGSQPHCLKSYAGH